MQRLFSTFPGSWPGLGLLILRITVGAIVVLVSMDPEGHAGFMAEPGQHLRVQVPAGLVSTCLALGLATPLASGLVVVALLAFGHDLVLSSRLMLAGASLSLIMLGPGAWSLDSRIYGRKQIRFGDD
ncbi:MAG: hypothetical protein U1E62_18615 [Alsobacter sp.]